MVRIEYKTQNGTVTIGGGDHPLINATSISGFGIPSRSYTRVEFAGDNGSVTIGKRDTSRIITISGTIRGTSKDLERMCRVFYSDGELWCTFNDIRRKIACSCIKFDDFEYVGRSDLKKFVVQLQADYPYFTNFYPIQQALFSERNLVNDTFTLPCVFTERINRANVNNTGNKEIYPVLDIINTSALAMTAEESGFTVRNITTGAALSIPNYETVIDEKITIDIPNRKIISSISGDITHLLSSDTADMSKFLLVPGINEISFDNPSSQYINAFITFSPEYYTAIRS